MPHELTRKERYAAAIDAGYSSVEARRIRDYGISRYNASIAIRSETRQTRPHESKSARREKFSQWSSSQLGFPDDIRAQIEQWNRDEGLPFRHSRGYRRFYWLYVEGVDFSEIDDILRDNDT